MRHAHADHVQIALAVDDAASVLEVSVTDNGRGLDPERLSSGGIGLAGIRERVLANGGELQLNAATPSGLALTARFPLR
jgi:signal transduction histidine kinase